MEPVLASKAVEQGASQGDVMQTDAEEWVPWVGKCPAGHQLTAQSTSAISGGSRRCDVRSDSCVRKELSRDDVAWQHCSQCDYDVCPDCALKLSVAKELGHWMVKFTSHRVRDGPALNLREVSSHKIGTVVASDAVVTEKKTGHRWIKLLGEERYMICYNAEEKQHSLSKVELTPDKATWSVSTSASSHRFREGPSLQAQELGSHPNGAVVTSEAVVEVILPLPLPLPFPPSHLPPFFAHTRSSCPL